MKQLEGVPPQEKSPSIRGDVAIRPHDRRVEVVSRPLRCVPRALDFG